MQEMVAGMDGAPREDLRSRRLCFQAEGLAHLAANRFAIGQGLLRLGLGGVVSRIADKHAEGL